MHHTKDKGDLGVAKIIADLTAQGYSVLLPLSEHLPFDLVAYKDNTLKRVSVKFRKLSKVGTLEVTLKSIWSDKHGVHRTLCDKSQIDVLAIYCPDNDSCCYFDPKKIDKTLVIRVTPPKNNQKKRVNLFSDCRGVP